MRSFVRWLMIALVAGTVTLDRPVQADAQQPCNESSSNEDFTLTPTQGSYLFFPTATVSDFNNTTTVVTKTYSLNVNPRKKGHTWDLCIRAWSSTMLNGKDIGDIQWRLAGSSNWKPLTTYYAQVIREKGQEDVTLEFRIKLNWSTDVPDFYGAFFTLAAL